MKNYLFKELKNECCFYNFLIFPKTIKNICSSNLDQKWNEKDLKKGLKNLTKKYFINNIERTYNFAIILVIKLKLLENSNYLINWLFFLT